MNRFARVNGAAVKARILLLEDDENTAETFRWALRSERIEVTCVSTGREGLTTARRLRFDLLLVDLRLPDISGMDVLRTLRAEGVAVPFIVVSGYTPVPVVVEAMRLGAITVLEKPLDVDDLVRAVRAVIEPGAGVSGPRVSEAARVGAPHNGAHASARVMPGNGSTAERWAALILNVAASPSDPKTMANWARAVSVSRSVICEYCRLVHVSAHDARDFARMLRAIRMSGTRWQPEAVMDVADARTLRKLLQRAGLTGVTSPPTFDAFFTGQAWIPQDNPGLIALRALMADVLPR